MDIVLYYIRDNLVGTHYFIYAFILWILLFSIVGYLFKQKYGKLEIKLNTSQSGNQKEEIVETKKKKEKINNKQKNSQVSVQPNIKSEPVKMNKVSNVNIKTPVVSNNTNKEINQTPVLNPTPLPATPQVNNPQPMPNPNQEPIKEPLKTKVVTPTLNGTIPEIK